MPAPSSMTFEEAVAEVLGRIGQEDDGVANPLLAAEARRQINAAQRMLAVEYDLLAKGRRALVEVAGGRRFIDLPADALPGQITAAEWLAGEDRLPLTCGIAPDHRGVAPSAPLRYDLTPSTGIVSATLVPGGGGTGYTDGTHVATVSGGTRRADGHDPVISMTIAGGSVTALEVLDSGSELVSVPTIAPPGAGSGFAYSLALGGVQMVELCPVPASSGTLELRYRATVQRLEDDDDLLSLDDEAVIGKAAVLLAAIKNLPIAKNLADFHLVYMDSLRKNITPGRTASLSAWRRDAPLARQMLPRLDPRRP